MSIRETIQEVMKVFQRLPNSDIASESKTYLKDAAEQLSFLLDEEIEEPELKKASDLIIVGAIIYAMAISDKKYNNPGIYFGDEHVYSRLPSDVFSGFTEDMTFREKLIHIGTRALTTKDLPFTGIFDESFYQDGFTSLSSILPPEHFAAYNLNTDPATMDPAPINQPGKEKRAKAKDDKKWVSSFGIKDYDYQADAFQARKKTINGLITEEDRQHSVALWKWRGLVVVAALVAPLTAFISLFFTVPWLKNKREEIKTEYDNRTWVATEFTREEYDGIRAQKRALKATFTEQVGKDRKAHKICIGLDYKGKETSKKENIQKVIMLSDKEQAKRWSPKFLKEATQASYNETKVQSSILHNNIG